MRVLTECFFISISRMNTTRIYRFIFYIDIVLAYFWYKRAGEIRKSKA